MTGVEIDFKLNFEWYDVVSVKTQVLVILTFPSSSYSLRFVSSPQRGQHLSSPIVIIERPNKIVEFSPSTASAKFNKRKTYFLYECITGPLKPLNYNKGECSKLIPKYKLV